MAARRFAMMVLGLVCLLPLVSCDDTKDDGKNDKAPTDVKITIDGKEFKLETALDIEKRFKGLSGRKDIDENGGMIFVFPDKQVHVQNFVMRDCPAAIDIIYLDRSQHVTAVYAMQPETERSEEEKVLTAPPGVPDWAKTNDAYEERLKQYSSKFPAQFVIELKGNTLDIGEDPDKGKNKRLKVKPGDKIELPAADLKKWAT
ncbi:MAG: DUF192 domain-containing protein [Phycisphaerales bacterium]|nr:MAG: DUF192 domain-containing protein [Phycisphaerales bacterium]